MVTDRPVVDIDDPKVIDSINMLISRVTADSSVTPYIGLERIRQVLSAFHIFLPKYNFLEGNRGNAVFAIEQFGDKYGIDDQGRVVNKISETYKLYFEYVLNEEGLFDVYSEVVTGPELAEILTDYDAESDYDEETHEESLGVTGDDNYSINTDEHKGLSYT